MNICFPLLSDEKDEQDGPNLCSYDYVQASLLAQTVKNLSAMRKTQVRPLGQEDALEKGMVIHSSILAWRIPWRKEPGRLQSTLQRGGHD